MRRKMEPIVVIVVLVLLFCTGCGSDSKNIVGRWICIESTYESEIGVGDEYEFFSDGMGTQKFMGFKYPLKWTIEKKTSTIAIVGEHNAYSVKYTLDGDNLIFYDLYYDALNALSPNKEADGEQFLVFERREY